MVNVVQDGDRQTPSRRKEEKKEYEKKRVNTSTDVMLHSQAIWELIFRERAKKETSTLYI